MRIGTVPIFDKVQRKINAKINLVEVEESLSLVGDIDSVFYTNRVNYIGSRRHINSRWTVPIKISGSTLGQLNGTSY